MLRAAIFISLYSYLIFFLGVTNNLKPQTILLITLIFFSAVGLYLIKRSNFKKKRVSLKDLSKLEILFLFLIFCLTVVNFVGALGPELAFDALWYHLTIPKVFIEEGRVFFIKGGLFYYSLMPKLTEMLYIPSLMFGGEILAKVVHFSFGLLTSFALFKLIRLYLKREWALLGIVIFLSNLVVSWLMTTAYSDLSRAFFEVTSLYYLLLFARRKSYPFLILSALLLGFAISVKLVSLGTLIVFIFLILTISHKSYQNFLKFTLIFLGVSITVPLPYFFRSFIHTGNPIYPLFSELGLRNFSLEMFYPLEFFKRFVEIFMFSADPISPLFVLILPLMVIKFGYLIKKHKLLTLYAILTYIVWYTLFQEGGSRFLTSYFPGYILLGLIALSKTDQHVKRIYVFAIIVVAVLTILYRGAANSRYIPVVLGLESKEDFLMQNLNFEFADFYDEGGEIKKIVGDDLVLLSNMHNLYYIDFRFTLKEWDNASDAKYLLIQGDIDASSAGGLIYLNQKTHVKLYRL